MKKKFAEVSPFVVDPEPIEKAFIPQENDFEPATSEERESIVEKHKSVSYWRDAARRFRANTVSMVALFVFILILLFAFLGPALIPYDYEQQYRTAQKLAPFEFSQEEQMIQDLGRKVDGFYATTLQAGSMTAIRKGNYYISADGKTYAFNVSKAIEKAVLVYSKDAENPLFLIKIKDLEAGGVWNNSTPIETTDIPAEGAAEIKLVSSIFPHVFGTDSAGRDLMARTMFGARVSIIIGIAAALIVLFTRKEQSGIIAAILLAAGIALPLVCIGTFLLRVNRQAARVRLKPDQLLYTVTMRNEGVRIVNDRNEKDPQEVSWDSIHQAFRKDGCIYLYVTPYKAFLLPSKQADAPDHEVWDFIRKRLGEGKCKE